MAKKSVNPPPEKTIDFETFRATKGGFKQGDVHMYDMQGRPIKKPLKIPLPLPKD